MLVHSVQNIVKVCVLSLYKPSRSHNATHHGEGACQPRSAALCLDVCWCVIELTFRKGTRYGCGEELSSWYNLLVKSSGSIFASCQTIDTECGTELEK